MGTRVSIHSPTFTGCWFVWFFLKQLVLASIRRQTNTNDSYPGGKKLTRKAATQVQRGMYGKDNGALTGAPLCHRRWHVSRPRSRSSVVLESDRERGGGQKNPLRESNNLGTQRVRASRGRSGGSGRRKAGDARGPLPGKSTRSYPRRARCCRIYSWQLLRVAAKDPLRSTGVVGVCWGVGEEGRGGERRAGGGQLLRLRGKIGLCCQFLRQRVSQVSPGGAAEGREQLRLRLSPIGGASDCLCEETHACTHVRTHTHARRSVSRILGSTLASAAIHPSFLQHLSLFLNRAIISLSAP